MAKKTVVKNTPQQSQPVSEKNDLSINQCVKMMADYNLVPSVVRDSVKIAVENENLRKINDFLNEGNKDQRKSIDSLKKEVENFQKQVEQLQKDTTFSHRKIRKLENKKADSVVVAERDSLKKENDNLMKDTTELHAAIGKLRSDSATMSGNIINLNNKINSLNGDLKTAKEPKSIPQQVGQCLQSGPFCGVLIALVIAVTLIALRRGFTFTKGNTSICIGQQRSKKKKEV
ncbi:MAG: hypothetical protein J5521_06370 [Lachnospiraceae bacterium]|nr:hypothetical protein [Lachnospiraceae bacterium]